MSVFQMLSAGNTAQVVPGGDAACPDVGTATTSDANTAARPKRAIGPLSDNTLVGRTRERLIALRPLWENWPQLDEDHVRRRRSASVHQGGAFQSHTAPHASRGLGPH